MQAALEPNRGAAGIRLLQDSFNVASLSLYASLGFEVKEPAVVMSGRPISGPAAGIEVRPLEEPDIRECEQLCLKVHGFERTNELRDALQVPVRSPFVAVGDGRITAYATTLTFFPAAYAVAEAEDDVRALILGALMATEEPASFLLPTRQAELFRWCLDEGLRVVKPMTYMAFGEYRQPAGRWIPSVLYWRANDDAPRQPCDDGHSRRGRRPRSGASTRKRSGLSSPADRAPTLASSTRAGSGTGLLTYPTHQNAGNVAGDARGLAGRRHRGNGHGAS